MRAYDELVSSYIGLSAPATRRPATKIPQGGSGGDNETQHQE